MSPIKGTSMSPDEHRMLKVGSIYVPVIMVFSMIVGAIYFTYVVSTERAKIYTNINSVRQDLKTLTLTVNRFIETTSSQLRSRPYGTFDPVKDCLEHEILNPGWKCKYAPHGWSASIE